MMMKTTQMSGIIMIKAWIFKPMTDPFRVDGLINAMKHLRTHQARSYISHLQNGTLGKSSTQKFKKPHFGQVIWDSLGILDCSIVYNYLISQCFMMLACFMLSKWFHDFNGVSWFSWW